jgi:hypothetical protein
VTSSRTAPTGPHPEGVVQPGRAPAPGSPPALAADGTPLWDGYVNDKDHDLRRNWGLKLPLWEAIRDEGGGGCAVCGRTNARLVVDECHETGEFRGLLCDAHNRKLDERMVSYILDPPARRVARRLGLPGLFVPTAIREAKARRRQARRAPAKPGPSDDEGFAQRVRAALEQTTEQGA